MQTKVGALVARQNARQVDVDVAPIALQARNQLVGRIAHATGQSDRVEHFAARHYFLIARSAHFAQHIHAQRLFQFESYEIARFKRNVGSRVLKIDCGLHVQVDALRASLHEARNQVVFRFFRVAETARRYH